jgi:curved DNA-binding protein CbpA
LSDPVLRAKYNEFGPKESAPEGGFVDPEEVFGAIFGGDRFLPIIGTISLAKDMKAALQEAEDAEEDAVGAGGKQRIRDAKGREILSEEEKAKKEEKERQKAAEVIYLLSSGLRADKLRKRRGAKRGFRNSWIISNGSWASSQSQRLTLTIKMPCRAGGRCPDLKLSKSATLLLVQGLAV